MRGTAARVSAPDSARSVVPLARMGDDCREKVRPGDATRQLSGRQEAGDGIQATPAAAGFAGGGMGLQPAPGLAGAAARLAAAGRLAAGPVMAAPAVGLAVLEARDPGPAAAATAAGQLPRPGRRDSAQL